MSVLMSSSRRSPAPLSDQATFSASSSPFSPAHISKWPPSILFDVFLHTAAVSVSDSPTYVEGREEEKRGGVLDSWLSHEVLKPLTLVCRSWNAAATTALLRHAHVGAPDSASQLLDTLTANPDLRGKIKRLSVGLSDDGHCNPAGENAILACSQTMIQVLSLCDNLVALQLRPLHSSIADDLLAALQPLSEKLETLVFGPRYFRTEEKGAYLSPFQSSLVEPIVRLLIRLRVLEIDAWARDGPTARWTGVPAGVPGSASPLKQLSVKADLDDEVLEGLLNECGQLEVLRVYAETALRSDKLLPALRRSTRTLKRLYFVNNPPLDAALVPPQPHLPMTVAQPTTPVLFGPELVSSYTSLTSLHLSSNLTSRAIFQYLPSAHTLRHLFLCGLAPAPIQGDYFHFSDTLLDDLRNPAFTPIDALESVTVEELQDDWTEAQVQSVQEALQVRGVTFRFIEVSASTRSGTSDAGSVTSSIPSISVSLNNA